MIALGVYLLSLFLGISWVQKRRGWGRFVLLFSVLTFWAGMWIAGIRVEQRWDQVTLSIRSILWQDGIEMIGEHPWTGAGLGSYRDRSRMNWDEMLAKRFPTRHAEHIESDALEWVLEMGVPGGLVLLLAIGCLILGGIKWQKEAPSRWWGAWVLLSGGIAFGVHELGDFGLRKMPVFLLVSLLIGATPVLIGCPSVIVDRGTRPKLFGFLGFGFALLGCFLALVTIPRGVGEIYFHRAKTMEQMARNVEGELVRSRPFQVALEWYSVAGWWLFGDSRSHLSYSRLLEDALESRRVVVPKNIVPEIRSAYQQAILCAPCDPDPHLGLALHHARFGEVWEAKMHADLAEKLQPTSAWVHERIGRVYW
ncbi:MAG: O-antigen ligase family protein, partial [Planctomycetota bacterium]|nr:O-antigen ligase family protein [Planctomycetota bacterium]